MTRDDFPPALVELAHMMGLTPFIVGGFDYDLVDDARFLQRERVGLDDVEAVKSALGGEVAGYPQGYYRAVIEAVRHCDPDLLEAYQSRRVRAAPEAAQRRKPERHRGPDTKGNHWTGSAVPGRRQAKKPLTWSGDARLGFAASGVPHGRRPGWRRHGGCNRAASASG